MEPEDAFGEDVTPREFFLEKLPALHRSRLEIFELYSNEPLRFSVLLTDRGERYSIELGPEDARAREGEFIEFPVATIEATTEHWELVKRRARVLVEEAEEQLRRDPPHDRIDAEFLDALERYDGTIGLTVLFDEVGEQLEAKIVLNDYEEVPGARRVDVDVPLSLAQSVVRNEMPAEEAARSLDLGRDLSLAFDLSGLAIEHFPALSA